MKPRHIALAVVLMLVWGVNFIFIVFALRSTPPLLLAALRFVVAALPVFFLTRPAVAWPTFIAIGSTLFVGQFALLFTAMAVGMPPGLASIVCQLQVFLTIGFAAAALGELPTGRQLAGSAVALVGLVLVGSTVGSAGFTLSGLLLSIASAASWAVGNVLLRSVGKVDMLSLISWLSLIPPIPLLILALLIEGPGAVGSALTHPTWLGVVSLLYIGVLATTFGYGFWGHLLKLYPAATVTPFALLVPVFGMLSAALVVGETFGPVRFAGVGLILIGLALVVLPGRWLRWS